MCADFETGVDTRVLPDIRIQTVITDSSPCGSFSCCVECITCFESRHNILEDEGTLSLIYRMQRLPI